MADKQMELEELKHKYKMIELAYERETRQILLERELTFTAQLKGLMVQQQPQYQQQPQQLPPPPLPPQEQNIMASQQKYGGV